MKTITVCDKCLQASCWLGYFMCELSRDAGTVEKTIKELEMLELEDPSWWKAYISYEVGLYKPKK